MLASIVIPTLVENYDNLLSCLACLSLQSTGNSKTHDFEVLIVANQADFVKRKRLDRLMARVYQLGLKPRVFCFADNLGFAEAVNYGFDQAEGRYLLTINDDAFAAEGWLESLITTAQNENAGMAASKIRRISPAQAEQLGKTVGEALLLGKKQIDKDRSNSNPSSARTKILIQEQLSRCFNQWQAPIDSLGFAYEMKGRAPTLTSLPEVNKKQELPFGPDAAACLYSRKLVESAKGFDPSFFAYLEDVDLAFRARKLGFHCVLAEQAEVFHIKHQTSKNMGSFKSRQDMINWWRLILKNYGWHEWKRYGTQVLIERLRNFSGYVKQLLTI